MLSSFFISVYMNKLYSLVNIINGDILRVRLGYACISVSVDDTSSSPYTYSEYLEKGNLDKLDSVIISNLDGLEKIIIYNIKNNIHFYRMSSKIIPLATKEDVCFDYVDRYKHIYSRIGKMISDNGMRVDFHPDQFCVLNSTNKEVVENSIKILDYHFNLLEALNVREKILVLHVGSSVLGKDNSIRRFINNFEKLPDYLKRIIAIENDDKVFNANDVIFLSDKLEVPIVLDYHHHKCNRSEINIKKILDSWSGMTPKMHFSSSKSSKDFRSHSDYIDSDEFIKFIDIVKEYDVDIDVMIEAKAKDEALFRLVRELKYKTDYKFVDDTTFYV